MYGPPLDHGLPRTPKHSSGRPTGGREEAPMGDGGTRDIGELGGMMMWVLVFGDMTEVPRGGR